MNKYLWLIGMLSFTVFITCFSWLATRFDYFTFAVLPGFVNIGVMIWLLLFLKNRALGVPWIIQSLLYILVGLFGLAMYKWNLSGLVFVLPVLSYVAFGWLYLTSLLNWKLSLIWVGAQLLFFAFFQCYVLFFVDNDAFLILLPLDFSLLNFWAFYWMNKKISFLRF